MEDGLLGLSGWGKKWRMVCKDCQDGEGMEDGL